MTCMLGVGLHTACAGVLAGGPVTHWSTVPSLPAKPGEHPLRSIVAGAAHGLEAPLRASAEAGDPRSVNASHFQAEPLAGESHVLLLDDTWTTGGHAQSAAALRAAGATHVSIMVVAQWVRLDFADN